MKVSLWEIVCGYVDFTWKYWFVFAVGLACGKLMNAIPLFTIGFLSAMLVGYDFGTKEDKEFDDWLDDNFAVEENNSQPIPTTIVHNHYHYNYSPAQPYVQPWGTQITCTTGTNYTSFPMGNDNYDWSMNQIG